MVVVIVIIVSAGPCDGPVDILRHIQVRALCQIDLSVMDGEPARQQGDAFLQDQVPVDLNNPGLAAHRGVFRDHHGPLVADAELRHRGLHAHQDGRGPVVFAQAGRIQRGRAQQPLRIVSHHMDQELDAVLRQLVKVLLVHPADVLVAEAVVQGRHPQVPRQRQLDARADLHRGGDLRHTRGDRHVRGEINPLAVVDGLCQLIGVVYDPVDHHAVIHTGVALVRRVLLQALMEGGSLIVLRDILIQMVLFKGLPVVLAVFNGQRSTVLSIDGQRLGDDDVSVNGDVPGHDDLREAHDPGGGLQLVKGGDPLRDGGLLPRVQD